MKIHRGIGAALFFTIGALSHARAQEVRVLVPMVVLYPGDIITDAALTESVTSVPLSGEAAMTDRVRVVGKVAKRTLLPGKPIPAAALDEPRLVANGATVRLLFEEPGLSIATSGQALQAGTRGDLIRVRNAESGVIVTGRVQSDGSIRVGG